jgi:hypothetical protein
MSRTHNRPVELAAQAIVDLINSQPQSPGRTEIAAIIETIMNVRPLPLRQASALSDCKALDENTAPSFQRYAVE